MYAVVDIETTGGYAANNDITEVAIVLHDGTGPVLRFVSLVKPVREIPRYIQSLTGITPDMVSSAPSFEALAPRIHELLEGRIFVAHHVNFDYSFLKHHLSLAGFELNTPRLCTVRLCRKVFPGLPSYSLGKLCTHFDIPVHNRHRAGGDADATVLLFDHMLRHDAEPHIRSFLKRGSGEYSLPSHLPVQQIEQLPYTPGVYYFHDEKDKVIYVGKAKNLRYRVKSHFTTNDPGKKRQEFLRHIHRISYKSCATELMAFLLESMEIKKRWPRYNNSQKKVVPLFGIYRYTDQSGYERLVIDRHRRNLEPLHTFSLWNEGHVLLQQLVREHALCPRLSFLQTDDSTCIGIEEKYCKGACIKKEKPEKYNKRVQKAVHALKAALPSFAIVDRADSGSNKCYVLMEQGRFYGMGEVPEEVESTDLETLKGFLTPYPDNEHIRSIIMSFASKDPGKVVSF